MKMRTILSIAAIPVLVLAGPALAAPKKTDTPADTIHPNIHGKVGQGDGTNANPNGANANGGNIHGIGNNPGQSDASPSDGVAGFADQLNTVHGGIDAYNPRVIP